MKFNINLFQQQQNLKVGPNRHKIINRKQTPLQQILQQANPAGASKKIVPEPGWIPVTKFDLPKVPLGLAGRPIPQTLQQANKKSPPEEIIQQVISRNKLAQQNRLEALLKKTKLPSIKFPPISQITGPTPIEPASTIGAAFKKNHARFNANNQVNGKHRAFVQSQSPTPESNRPVVVVTTIHPNLVKQHNIPISSSSSPSPLIQIVESRSIRPPSQSPHENSIFPLHLNSRRPNNLQSENKVPLTVYPNDTVLIQYHTTLEKLNTDSKTKSGKTKSIGRRRERATFNAGFEERINQLSCKDEAEELIREILEAPLRKRNALLGILRMREKERKREGKESIPQGNNQNNNFRTNFQQTSVNANLNSFTKKQNQSPKVTQNIGNQGNGGRQNKQQAFQQNNNGNFISNNVGTNQFQNQAQLKNQVKGNRNTANNQKFKGNKGGQQSNFQQSRNNRNKQNQQALRFGGNNNDQQAKQSTQPAFSIVRTTPVTSTRRPITTTIRTTRQPKNIPLNQRNPQPPQQRAIQSENTVPAKITVNEQFQHFPAFQQISAKKKKQSVSKNNSGKSLKGSFKQPSLQNSNFEQAFLTKIPAKQVQTQEDKRQKQAQKQAEKQAQKQAQLERARQRLQRQQQQQQKLKNQNNIVGINGKPLNQQQQKKVLPQTIEPPKFFIDVPKKTLNGQFQSQNTNQGNSAPRKQNVLNSKPVFLPGEFTEVVTKPPQTAFDRQNQQRNSFNNNNQVNQQQNTISNTNPNPNRKKQGRKNGNNNRNKTPRQNFSSDAKQFSNNAVNHNRQPKTVNQNSKPNQILTTSRPQVTQTFVPRQILKGNNNAANDQSQNVNNIKGENSKGGNTFTIEQFLQRYPEVKRLSSRFGDDKNVQNRVVGQGQKNDKSNQNGRNKNGRKGKKKNSRRNKNKRNKNKQQQVQQNQVRQQKAINRPQPSNPQQQNIIVTSTQRPIVTTRTTRRPIVTTTTTTRRPIVTTTIPIPPPSPAPRNIPRQQKKSQPSRPNPQGQTRPNKQNQINPNVNSVPDVDFPDDELSSVDYSYLYYQDYYEELVPVHHRFNQLAKSTTTTTRAPRPKPNNKRKKKNKKNKNKKNKGNRQGKRNQLQSNNGNNKNKQPQSNSFSFFTMQPADGEKKKGGNQGNFPNFPSSSNGGSNQNAIKPQKAKVVPSRRPVTQPPGPAPTKFKLKPSKVGEPKAKPVAVQSKNPLQSGPYGYVDKGTFFTDSHVKGFPEMIEVIYQGFVWALNMYYPDKQKEKHGGVHTILKDKVKRQKIFFKDGDYIVRVSGRASPYNINRLTFYTAKGKKYGPWGDRRSKDSIDFDVSAPPGHGLQYFSGTVDFGVPFRSISFHWSPHE